MNRKLAAAVAAATIVGAVTATPAAHAARRVTRPTVTYTEHFNATGQNCTSNGYYCWETIKIDKNPSNYGVRAWAACVQGGPVNLGSWHYSVGSTSNTASCPIGEGIQQAGFDWKKSSPTRVICYTYPSPNNTGQCGG